MSAATAAAGRARPQAASTPTRGPTAGPRCLPTAAGRAAVPAPALRLASSRPTARRHGGVPAQAAAAVMMAPPQAVAALPQLPPLNGDYESQCAFADFANWLIPGRVMLGRYPFLEPSRCRSRDMGEEQLRQLIGAGITTFVCLQAEIPAQEDMRIGGVDGFVPYRASATLMATALSPPPSIEEVAALRTPDLDRFLPPRRHPAAWQSRRRIELDFAHCPIVDLGLPETQQLRSLLADISQRLDAGQNLYVHCWGGRGRAGLVGACLLAHLYGLPAEEALERVQRSFDTRKDGGRRSPETDEQHAFVRDLIAQHCA